MRRSLVGEAGATLTEREVISLTVITSLIAIFAHSLMLFNFVLPIDGETKDNFMQTLTLGRWFHTALRSVLFPEPYVPLFTNLLALVAIALAAVAAALFFRLSFVASIAFGAIFVTFANLSYQFEFTNQSETFSIGYGLAIVSAAIAWHAIDAGNVRARILELFAAVVLLACALGIYQSFVLVPVTLLAGKLLFVGLVEKRDYTLLRLVGCILLYMSLAIVVYFLINFTIQKYFSINGLSYFSGFLQKQNNILTHLYNGQKQLVKGLQGRSAFGFSPYLLCLPLSIGILIFAGREKVHRTFVLTCALGIICLSPFAFTLISAGPLPPRTYVSANLSLAILVVLLLQCFRAPVVLGLGSALLAAINVQFVSALAYSDIRVREADIAMANRIETIAQMRYPGMIGPQTHVYFHGPFRNQEDKKLENSDIFGSSFFAWDGGNSHRITRFMDFYGIASYGLVERKDVEAVKGRIAAMPTWPDSRSVQLFGDVLVVRLGAEYGWLPFPVDR